MPGSSLTLPSLPPCLACGSKRITKKGKRRTRHEDRQRHRCDACGHFFVREITKSQYPVRLVMEALSHYNLGYPSAATLRYLRRRFRIEVPEKTFRSWYV